MICLTLCVLLESCDEPIDDICGIDNVEKVKMEREDEQ